MKEAMTIKANLNDPGLLRTIVEILATRHVDMGYGEADVPQQWKAVETSSTQAYVLGTVDIKSNIQGSDEKIDIPFSSGFLFTCIKNRFGQFNLKWSSSLS